MFSTFSIQHNERLEFLGDAILEFVCTSHLYFMFPEMNEGGLVTHRSSLVQNRQLTCIAKVNNDRTFYYLISLTHIIIRYRMRALSRDRGPICPYKSTILDFLQKLPFAFAQNVLGRANFALINPPFCGDNFLTDTR